MLKNNKIPKYLVLVNKNNYISEAFLEGIELVSVPNFQGETIQIEKKTYEAYLSLNNALLIEGIEIGLDSAYRSLEEQQSIMNDFIDKYDEDYARKIVATPGTSEHHTGLAIDVVVKKDGKWIEENNNLLKQADAFDKIHKRLPEYGFILRYPKGKELITGYDYEPWHFRYVGKDIAKKIYKANATLEEFLNHR